MTPEQKTWILSFPSMRKLTSAVNSAVQKNKIGWQDVKEIYRYYQNFKKTSTSSGKLDV
jgi:hypothetical protein